MGALEAEYFGGASPTDHKTIQLCRQVEEAISMALFASADPTLRDLHVIAVEPLRGAALLRVLVTTETEEALDPQLITDKLDRARGYLRAEVAKAINRKRVPGLELCLVLQPKEVDHDASF